MPAPIAAPPPVRRRRWLRRTLAGVVVLVVLVTGGAFAAYTYLTGRISHVAISYGSGPRPAAAPAGAETVLLVGSDSRSDGQFQGSGSTYVGGQRSDTMILARLDSSGVSLLSIPRDTWVTVPAYTDSSGTHPAGKSKINAAFSEGGPSLLIQTLESNFTVRVDHFVQIDFAGFQSMTAALGGVNVCLRAAPGGTNLSDPSSGFVGRAGINHLNGEQALAFVRQRYNLPQGDLDRIRRQQQFLAATLAKATSTGVLTDPPKLFGFLEAATSAITTDSGTSDSDLRRIASRLKGLTSDKLRTATIPVTAPPYQVDGQDVLLYDRATVTAELVRLGYVPASAATPSATTPSSGTSSSGTSSSGTSSSGTSGSATVPSTPAAAATPAATDGSGCTY